MRCVQGCLNVIRNNKYNEAKNVNIHEAMKSFRVCLRTKIMKTINISPETQVLSYNY